MKLNVLSLFDGLSGAQMALKKLGVVPEKYFASEIDEYAIKIAMKNFPNTIQLGDVMNWESWNLPKIDLLIGGSPCQDLSVANSDGQGLDGEKSKLFWKFVDVLNALNPRYFVLENVESMKTKDFVIISNALGVEPIMLDAGLVSAQRRKRYFWTNIPNVKKPSLVPSRTFPNNKKGLVIADILEENAVRKQVNVAPERIIETSYGVRWNISTIGQQKQHANNPEDKKSALVGSMWKTLPMIVQKSHFHGLQGAQAIAADNKFCPIDATFGVFDDLRIEQLTWTELERLAGLPDFYTDLGEENRVEPRGRAIGNGFQIDIVAHLLSFMRGFPEPLRRTVGQVKAVQENLFEVAR